MFWTTGSALHESGDCWLWPEEDGVRWWTPYATGLLARRLPGEPEFDESLADLRDRKVQVPLEEALHPDLVALLSDLLQSSPCGVRLHLRDDLPEIWHRFPFVWLNHNDRLLLGRLVPIIYCPSPALSDPNSAHSTSTVILDLWPHQSCKELPAPVFHHLVPQGSHTRVQRGTNMVNSFMEHSDLSQFGAAILIGHGTETCGHELIQLEKGGRWSFPPQERMPSLVMLLLCGTDEFNLDDEISRLFRQGADHVIAPVGQIDVCAADQMLRHFLENNSSSKCLEDTVLSAQGLDEDHAVASRLVIYRARRLFGPQYGGDTTTGSFARKCDLASCDATALVGLLDSISFNASLDQADLADMVELLFQALNLDYGDPVAENQLLTRLDEIEDNLQPLTQSWVMPLMAFLAENYNHKLLEKYEKCYNASPDVLPTTPYSHYGWAKVYCRQGRLVDGVQELVKGLHCIDKNRPCALGGPALISQLISVFVKLNLPQTGTALFDRHLETCLANRGDALLERHRRNRLDRLARLALARGEAAIAAGLFHTKRAQEIRQARDGLRELAWLTYIAACCGLSGKQNVITQAKDALRDVKGILQGLGAGNESEAYLLRGVAAWAWVNEDQKAGTILEPYIPEIRKRMFQQDPAPFAATLFFIEAYRRDVLGESVDQEVWGEVAASLEARYKWYSLAVYSLLMGRTDKADNCLEKFHRLRVEVCRQLSGTPDWIQETLACIDEEIAAQEEQEYAILTAEKQDFRAICRVGLIPC